MIQGVLGWFDVHVWAYWLLAWSALALNYAWPLRSAWRESSDTPPAQPQPSRGHGVAWALLVFLTLLAWRWPVLLNPGNLSADESQQIAGALTLARHPLFWSSIDGGTAGPLDYFALLPLHLLGVPEDFFCARLTGLLLITAALVGLRQALRALYGETAARVGCLPVLSFFAFAMEADFLHYSTEHVPLALFAIAAGLLARLHRVAGAASRSLMIWLGVVLGSMPWAKLQAAPLGVALGVLAIGSLLLRSAVPLRRRLSDCAVLGGSACAPSLIAVGVILSSGQWTDFFNSYITYNRQYVNMGLPLADALRLLVEHAMGNRVFPCFVVPALLVGLVAGALTFRTKATRAPLIASLVCVAVALFVVAMPRHDFPHYLLFLVVPFGLWAGIAFGAFWQQAAHAPGRRRAALAVFALFMLVVPAANRAQQIAPTELGQLLSFWRHPISRVSRAILAVTRPGDTLTIWGWAPEYYVETGLPQGTREAHTQRQIEDAPLKSYYQQRFLDEMTRNHPTVFIDVVTDGGFGFSDNARFGFRSDPGLAALIDERYLLIATVEGVRIYLQRDRVAE